MSESSTNIDDNSEIARAKVLLQEMEANEELALAADRTWVHDWRRRFWAEYRSRVGVTPDKRQQLRLELEQIVAGG